MLSSTSLTSEFRVSTSRSRLVRSCCVAVANQLAAQQLDPLPPWLLLVPSAGDGAQSYDIIYADIIISSSSCCHIIANSFLVTSLQRYFVPAAGTNVPHPAVYVGRRWWVTTSQFCWFVFWGCWSRMKVSAAEFGSCCLAREQNESRI
jgi:hypothetical protein